MLEPLFNSYVKERVLLYVYIYGEGYAQEIRRVLRLSLRGVQLQLRRLEQGGVLFARKRDRTYVYQINPRYHFKKELIAILEKVLSALPKEDRNKYFTPRLRPRRIGKPD